MYRLLGSLICIWLVIRETLTVCGEGCLICDGKDTCKLCDANSLYVLVKDTCFKQNLEFCMISFNIDACAACFPGYYLETNLKCVTNPTGINEITNCEKYSSFTRCNQCAKNYYLTDFNRICEKVTTKIQNCKVYQNATHCAVCSDSILNAEGTICNPPDRSDDNCLLYSNKTICKTCQNGYFLNLNYYNEQIIDLYPQLISAVYDYSFTYNMMINLPQCTKITDIPNCIKLDTNFNCQECASGYYVNQTSLRECLQNPPTMAVVYSTDIPFCFKHNRVPTTVNGVLTIEVTCTFCFEGYYVAVNGKKCQKHATTVKNCKIYSQTINSECLLCVDGYFRANSNTDKCQLRGENNNCAVLEPMALACKNCTKTNYIKHYNDTFCSPPIAYCKTYNLDSKILTCKTCEANYYFNINTLTCELNTNFDPYCSYYNQDKKCEKCYLGFFYNKVNNKCEPSDAEYVSIANCADYDLYQKNTCVDCDNYNILTTLANTCKMIPFNVNEFKFDNIRNCHTYEVDNEGNYKCTKAMYMSEADASNPICIADNSKCTLRVLNTTDNLVYLNPKLISNCTSYQDTVSGQSSIKCLTCAKNITITDYFFTSNVCDTAEKMPWCPDGVLFRTETTNFCFNATGTGGRMFLSFKPDTVLNIGNIDNGTLSREFDTKIPESVTTVMGGDSSYSFCTNTGSGICYYKNKLTYNNKYPCINFPVVGNLKYCKRFDGINCGIQALYERKVSYNITLTEDSLECIIERIYHTTENCFKISDNFCVLCMRQYFPDRFKQVLYPMDFVETYLSHASETNMDKCIIYNSLGTECWMCEPGTGYKLNFSGRCILCTASDKVSDKTDLKCLSYFSESLIPGSCEKADDTYSPYLCIKCYDTYVATFDLVKKTPSLTIAEYLYVNGQKTYVYKLVDTFGVNECIKKTDLFISKLEYRDNSANCDWARKLLGTPYCLKCIFGYSGMIRQTSSGVTFIENCVSDPTCDINTRYIFNQTHVRQMLSCHKCTSDVKIITLYNYFESYATAANAIFKFSSDSVSWACETVDSGLDKNCLVQLKITDEIFKGKLGGKSYLCLTCPPKYKAITATVPDSLYPFEQVTACNFISNCKESNVTNICEQCDFGYTLSTDKTSCLANASNETDFYYCNEKANSGSIVYCKKCKNGYILLETATTYKCLQYNATNCQYFDESRCLQATKKMGTAYNIIYRRNFEGYYVNQAVCKNANSKVPNCEFYKSETTCYICADGYFPGNKTNACYPRNVANCMTYDDDTMKCATCYPGFDLTKDNTCVTAAKTSGVYNCSKYSGNYCTECNAGFLPVKINNGQGSLCLDKYISDLCEEVDASALINDSVLQCKTCKKLTAINTALTAKTFSLSSYSFIQESTFSTFKSGGNVLRYDATISGESYLRAAKTPYKNFQVCKKYGGVPDCISHDDQSFSRTFACLQCNRTSYLSGGKCVPRTMDSNCVTYNPTQDACLVYLDSTNYAFTYSTFDLEVMATKIDPYVADNSTLIFIDGCVKYKKNDTCEYCNSTMYLYDNLCLSVSILIPNCLIYDADMVCSKCEENYLLMENKCLQIYAKNCDGYLTNTKCLRCKPEYPKLSTDGNCYKNDEVPNCESFANPSSCHYCNTDFANVKGKCQLPQKYIDSCERHSGTQFCSKCASNTFLTGNMKSCLVNPTYDRNCKEFESRAYCIVCKPGYYFKGHSCYPCKTNPEQCWLCDYKNPSVCKVCRPGFYMNNYGECQQALGYQSNIVENFVEDVLNLKLIMHTSRIVSWIVPVLISIIFWANLN